MRSLVRNKRTIYYALYLGDTEVVDSDGYATGTYAPSYTEPQKLDINVSAASGAAWTREFGDFKNYDRTMVTTQDLPLDENSILWIDDLDLTHPHDYQIVQVAKSLNENRYAISKVKVRKGGES